MPSASSSPDPLEFDSRAAWRQWLAENHAVSTGVSLIIYKKVSGKTALSYEDAVKEALCYGWIDARANTLDGKRYLKPETITLMASDHIGPETGIIHDPFYFPGETSGFGLGFAVRTVVPANTSRVLDEYRWDGAAGTSFFVDPRDDMFTLIMLQAPSQGGRLRTAIKTLIYEAIERKN